jgi:hypothetical protein
MKGAGSLREARRSKHYSEGAEQPSEARSESRDRSEPGAFAALLAAVALVALTVLLTGRDRSPYAGRPALVVYAR